MNHPWHTAAKAVFGHPKHWHTSLLYRVWDCRWVASFLTTVYCCLPFWGLEMLSPIFYRPCLLLQVGTWFWASVYTRSLGDGWYSLHGLDWVAPAAAATVCKRENHQSPLHTGIVIIILEKVPEIQQSNLYPLSSLSVLTRFNEI